MYSTLLVGQNKAVLNLLEETLQLEQDIMVQSVESGESALKHALEKAPDLIILDTTEDDALGLDLIRRIMMVDAFINTAIISHMSEEEFHEEAEGLGVLARLSSSPGDEEIKQILSRLRGTPPRQRPEKPAS